MKINALMLTQSNNTYQRILPFILAVLLIFVIPMIMSRYGLTAEDIIHMLFRNVRKKDYSAAAEEERIRDKKNRKEPHYSNGGKNEMMQLVSTLTIFSRRNKTGLVYPGTIEYKEKTGNLVCFVVTRSKVIGINCFGFAGTISENDGVKNWNQHMNGADISIPNPLVLNKNQYQLARNAMNAAGLKDLPLKVVAVFTNRNVLLKTDRKDEVYTVEECISMLKNLVSTEEDVFDSMEISRKMSNITTRIVKNKKNN